MQAKLIRRDVAEECTIALPLLPVTLGRGDEAGVCLNDRWISRIHCEISERDGSLVVRDLGSKHGTIVNGGGTREAMLMPGDHLSIGLHTFEVDYQPAASRVSSDGAANGDSQDGQPGTDLRRRHPR